MRYKYVEILVIVLATIWLTLPTIAQTGESSIDPVTSVMPIWEWGGDELALDDAEAVLTRMEHGISVSFATTELVPGDVYTLWWVIFENPEYCKGVTCAPADIFLTDNEGNFDLDQNDRRQLDRMNIQTVQISQIRATSGIADKEGRAEFRAHLPIGDITDFVTFGTGLSKPMDAEFHIVLRTHGPADPEFLWDQHFTDWGGCPDPDDRLPCKNVQFATFAPVR